MPPIFLRTIEETAVSTWLRESNTLFGFWFVISWHAIGMGLLVGASVVIGLRLLGVGRDLPLAMLKRLYPILWSGFTIQVLSGIVLLIAYPTKSLTTVEFYIKLVLIGLAMVVMVKIEKRLPSSGLAEPTVVMNGKALAIWSIALWCGAITAGRLIAYTSQYAVYPSP